MCTSNLLKMAESVCGVFVVPKKNTKSSAWLYFSLPVTQDGKVIENEQDRPVCKVCGKHVLAKASNTTNLFQHLREHHPTAYAELGPKKVVKREYSSSSSSQPTLGSIITSSTLYSSNSPQAKDLNRAVAYHIAKDAMPLSTVDKPGFRFMISKLNPRYHLPSRKHFSDYERPRMYTDVRDNRVVPMLRQASFFAATTDMWTSGCNDAYITFTVHFISSEWELHTFCLETIPIYYDHTGQNIADTISAILENWDLFKDKMVAATTDSGSNIVLAFKILHAVQISFSDTILIWQSKRALTPLELKEHLVDVTHLWSCFIAAGNYRMPTDTEFSVLEGLVEVLKPLSYLTDALSGEKQVTASAVLPVMKHAESKLSAASTDSQLASEMKQTIWMLPVMKHAESKLSAASTDSQLASEMKQTIWNDLEARYSDAKVSEIVEVASFLDPRCKDQYLQNKDDIIIKIILECTENYGSIHEESKEIAESDKLSGEPESTVSAYSTGPPPAKRLKGLAALLKHIEQESEPSTSTLTPSQLIDKEITSYLDFHAAESDIDPLSWWKSEKGRFPNRAYIARKYLCICGTSVPSERVFSTAGHIASRSRGRLLPQNVSKLLFLAKTCSRNYYQK